jgi:hypothetical protein
VTSTTTSMSSVNLGATDDHDLGPEVTEPT